MKPCDKGPDGEMTCWKVGGLGELPAWIAQGVFFLWTRNAESLKKPFALKM